MLEKLKRQRTRDLGEQTVADAQAFTADVSRSKSHELLNGLKTGVGVHDGLSALLATRAAYEFLWVSSFATSAVSGLPDAGLLDYADIARLVSIVDRVSSLPIVVDMDAGYGDSLKVHHATEGIARAGASAVCIEDNPTSKRSSLYDVLERPLASIDEHCERIDAAHSATKQMDTAVIARTEALVAGLGVDAALDRAAAYVAAGADAVFVQAVAPAVDELLRFCRGWACRTPVFVAPTMYPQLPRRDLYAAGVTHYIFANHGVRAAHRAMSDVFNQLSSAEFSADVEGAISSVDDLTSDICAPG